MPNALERTAVALAKAALNSQQTSAPTTPAQQRARKPRVSTGRAMLLGAGLVVAGQALVKTKGRDALTSVRHGLAERIDGAPADEVDALDEEDGFDEPPEAEDLEYNNDPEADEDELPAEEEAVDEVAPRRRPQRNARNARRARS
jgi:hypothetical protein